MTADLTHFDAVEAYTSRLSVLPGEALGLHVRCATDTYDVEVCCVSRGDGAVVWGANGLVGAEPPTPDDADAHGCGWPVTVEIPIGGDWPSGVYLVTVRAHGAVPARATGHALFVVRAPRPTSPLLLVLATNTYNAYNAWGGRSLYTGGHEVSFDRPFIRGFLDRPDPELDAPNGRAGDDRKSPVAALGESPDVDGERYAAYIARHDLPPSVGSTGWHTYERRLVRWARRYGLEFDVAVSEDLGTSPDLTDGYTLVVGAGHDEYWSAAQRDGLERCIAGGGNYASLSGNTMFWQVRFDASGRNMTAHKYRAHRLDPVVGTAGEQSMTGMWADPLVGRPEWAVLGAGSAFGLYSRYGQSTPRASGGFTVYRDRHWMLDGTGARYGDVFGARLGCVGYETAGVRLGIDEFGLPVSVTPGAPPTEVVALAPSSNLGRGEYPAGSVSFVDDDQVDLEFVAARLYGDTSDDSLDRVRHGNAAMVTCRPFGDSGGEVVTIGTTDWVFALDDPELEPVVDRVTRNVLHRLGDILT